MFHDLLGKRRMVLPFLGGLALLGSCREEQAGTESEASGRIAAPASEAWQGEPSASIWAAAGHGDVAAVREHLNEGADANARDGEGMTPLMLAAEAGQSEVAELLAPRCTEGLDDALFLAACHDHAGIVELLAHRGACVHSRTREGRTALMVAAAMGADDAVRALLRQGANRYATDDLDHTAGQIAMIAGHIDLGRRLLARPSPEEFSLVVRERSGTAVPAAARAFVPGRISREAERRLGVSGERVTVSRDGEETSADGWGSATGELPSLPLVMREFHQQWFPFKIGKLQGEKVQLRFLYGSNDRITVRNGDTIPKTRLKIVSVSNGPDGGVVEIEDPRTGERCEIPVGREAAAGAPYAVLEGEGGRMIAEPGKIVQTSSGHRYRVVEVQPTKVVFENSNTGQLAAVILNRR